MLYLLFNVALLISSVNGVLSKEGVGVERERVMVGFPSHLREEVKQAAEALGARLEVELHRVDAIAVTLPKAARALLEAHPAVSYVEEDAIMEAAVDTQTWAWQYVDASNVWNARSGRNRGDGVIVCVVDSGLDRNHPDFGGLRMENDNPESEWEFTDCEHGTHVTGIIASQVNGQGILGVAPNAGIYTVRALESDNDGQCTAANSVVLNGVEECMDNDADVINLSLGSNTYSSTANSLYQQARNQGILVVGAAGNQGTSWLFYPASYSSVMSVAAVGRQSTGSIYSASFSNANNQVDICAPGVSVTSTVPGWPQYESWDGTSMAAPHVSAIAALLMSAKPSATVEQVQNCMQDTAYGSFDPPSIYYGHGFVQAGDALECIMNLGSEQPPNYEKRDKDFVFEDVDTNGRQ